MSSTKRKRSDDKKTSRNTIIRGQGTLHKYYKSTKVADRQSIKETTSLIENANVIPSPNISPVQRDECNINSGDPENSSVETANIRSNNNNEDYPSRSIIRSDDNSEVGSMSIIHNNASFANTEESSAPKECIVLDDDVEVSTTWKLRNDKCNLLDSSCPTDNEDVISTQNISPAQNGKTNNDGEVTTSFENVITESSYSEDPSTSIVNIEVKAIDKNLDNTEESSAPMECEVDPQIVFDIFDMQPTTSTHSKNEPITRMEFLDSTINQSNAVRYLLDAKSRELLQHWESIGMDGKKILSDLYWCTHDERGAQQIQVSEFKKDKITESLLKAEFITSAAPAGEVQFDFDTCIKLLTLSELKKVCTDFKLSKPKKKKYVGDELKKYKYLNDSQCGFQLILNRLRNTIKKCYYLSECARRTIDEVYVLMHLGMLGMDRSEDPTKKVNERPSLIIKPEDIEKAYPIPKSMEVDNASIIFSTRDEFISYLDAYKYSEEYFTKKADLKSALNKKKKQERVYENMPDIITMEENLKDFIIKTSESYKKLEVEHQSCCMKLAPWLWRFTPGSIYLEIINDGVDWLKENKEYANAVMLLDLLIKQKTFKPNKKGDFYKCKVQILQKQLQGNHQQDIADTLLEGLKADIPDDVKDILKPLVESFSNKSNIGLETRSELSKYKWKPVYFHNLNNDEVSYQHKVKGRVEKFCIDNYYKTTRGFTNGLWFESQWMPNIFALLFWDIIYTKMVGINGIFMSHYQKMPLDMYYDEFYGNRKLLIEDRLTMIANSSDEDIVEMMKESWQLAQGIVSVVKLSTKFELATGIANALGGRSLAAIFRRMVRSYNYVYWGFPDLILWDENPKRVMFREVKRNRDILRINQEQWLHYLKDHGMDAGVCYFKEIERKQKKERK